MMNKENIPAGHRSTDINPDTVLDVEELAFKMGITGDQAQDLIDRIGTDREALEQAARALKVR